MSDYDEFNEDVARKAELRDVMESVGGSADESDDRLADSFGSGLDGESSSGRRIGLDREPTDRPDER